MAAEVRFYRETSVVLTGFEVVHGSVDFVIPCLFDQKVLIGGVPVCVA
jgi:hypothetical protein